MCGAPLASSVFRYPLPFFCVCGHPEREEQRWRATVCCKCGAKKIYKSRYVCVRVANADSAVAVVRRLDANCNWAEIYINIYRIYAYAAVLICFLCSPECV